MIENIEVLARKFALQNAINFKGKANKGAVIGKLLSMDSDLKKDMKTLSSIVNEVIAETDKLSVDEQLEELKQIAPELLEKKEVKKKEGLKPLSHAVHGKVVMRASPSPSGPLHIGHSIVISLNSEYCRMYGGKFILRIEDTNSSNIYAPAYDMIVEEANWLTKSNVSEVIIQSDRLDTYYNYATKLIEKGGMYVCDCDSEEARELLKKKMACPCRDLSKEAQLNRWKDMFTKYKQGEAVARVKTELDNPNPAMRDFPSFRINEDEHPRKGNRFRVWPLMNFSVFVDDVESGMTHIIRGKDHADNAKRQSYLYKYFQKPEPVTLFVGKVNFTDLKIKCSTTRPLVEDGTYSGWDDSRLAFLAALRRRGYQPDAFVKYAVSLGVSLNDKTVEGHEFFKTVNAFNKELLEPTSCRYFFIKDPVKINIEGAPEQEVELDLHPDKKKGGRSFATDDEFFIDKEDLDGIKDGELIRLMDCLNFRKEKDTFKFVDTSYETFKNNGKLILHWLPSHDVVDMNIRMPDNSVIAGKAERLVSDVKISDVVQFERFGFCRKDSEDEFWFAHR